MLVTLHSIEQGRHLHGLIIISELELDVFFESSLADMYTKCVGSIDDAHLLFDKMVMWDAISWTSIITNLAP